MKMNIFFVCLLAGQAVQKVLYTSDFHISLIQQVEHAVRLARDAVKTNRCVVIGLQSTGEARTLEQLEKEDGELSDFVSTAKGW